MTGPRWSFSPGPAPRNAWIKSHPGTVVESKKIKRNSNSVWDGQSQEGFSQSMEGGVAGTPFALGLVCQRFAFDNALGELA
jgi:hypothetical protein